MGTEEERMALSFLHHAEGRTQDVDAMVGLMADDIVWQINVPSWRPRIGREAARKELEHQNGISTGLLAGSEIRTVASNDRSVFTERLDVFEMGDKQIRLHINGVLEVENGKITAWREYYDSADLATQIGVDVKFVVETEPPAR